MSDSKRICSNVTRLEKSLTAPSSGFTFNCSFINVCFALPLFPCTPYGLVRTVKYVIQSSSFVTSNLYILVLDMFETTS